MKLKEFSIKVNKLMDEDKAAHLDNDGLASVLIDFLVNSGIDINDSSIDGIFLVAAELKRRQSAQRASDIAARMIVDRLRG
jgi:hypothetical protein